MLQSHEHGKLHAVLGSRRTGGRKAMISRSSRGFGHREPFNREKPGRASEANTAKPKLSEAGKRRACKAHFEVCLAMPPSNDQAPTYRFEWDEKKNRQNIRKHGLDFADAEEMFNDTFSSGPTCERTMVKTAGLALVRFEDAQQSWSLLNAALRPFVSFR